MLSVMLSLYNEAVKANDAREMRRIERDMSRVGMDAATLRMLAAELQKGERK